MNYPFYPISMELRKGSTDLNFSTIATCSVVSSERVDWPVENHIPLSSVVLRG